MPTEKNADQWQTYEWHFIAEAWGTFNCEALALAFVKLRLHHPLQWFKSATQKDLAHYILDSFGQLAAFYGKASAPQAAKDRALSGKRLVTANPSITDYETFAMLLN